MNILAFAAHFPASIFRRIWSHGFLEKRLSFKAQATYREDYLLGIVHTQTRNYEKSCQVNIKEVCSVVASACTSEQLFAEF